MINLPFEIGFDLFRYGMPLSHCRCNAQHGKDLHDGYTAAKVQGASPKKPDHFDKKLLTIKDRSLVKNLAVTITAQDIKKALKETKGICPVTKKPFTFAEHQPTDWSVDRIDNTKGYDPGNIVIISVQANSAKGQLDLAGIIKMAFQSFLTETVLPTDDWLAMAKFYYTRLALNSPISFCLLVKDGEALENYIDFIVAKEMFTKENKKPSRLLGQLARYAGKGPVETANKLLNKRSKRRLSFNPGLIYDSPKLCDYFTLFRLIVVQRTTEFDPLLVDAFFG